MPNPPWPSTRSRTYQCSRERAGNASGNAVSAMALSSVRRALLREPGDLAYPLGHLFLPPPVQASPSAGTFRGDGMIACSRPASQANETERTQHKLACVRPDDNVNAIARASEAR